MARRIIYVSHSFPYPLGGPRIAYRHVEILRKNGFDAFLFDKTKEPTYFFKTDPALILTGSFRLTADDILVFPEPWASDMRAAKDYNVKKIVFCQNHFYVWHGLEDAASYQAAYNISTVFCCGDVIAKYLREVLQISDVRVVHNGIDRDLFYPKKKKLQIAYMPRKLDKAAAFVRDTFKRVHPRFKDVPWVEIANVSEDESARVLGESAVFFSFAFLEGFGLPAIEAMASEALVAGYTGSGGDEYATPNNGCWAKDGDWSAGIESLNTVLSRLSDDAHAAEQQKIAAKNTALTYSLERMERELVSFWRIEAS